MTIINTWKRLVSLNPMAQVSTCGNISGAYLILFTSCEISRGHLYVQIQDQSSGMK
jgi:hypothetical protein